MPGHELDALRAQLALEQGARTKAEADLAQLAYAVSHDLVEPLRKVSSFLKLLERKLGSKLDADSKEFLDYAVGGATRMNAMLQAMLEFSRIGRKEAPMADVDLAAAGREAWRTVGSESPQAHLEFGTSESPLVQVVPEQLMRLFEILFANALTFQPPGQIPHVKVEWRQEGTSWRVRVSDNGIGVQTGQQEMLFRMFSMLHPKGTYPGVGGGLAIAKRIIERHGGTIGIEPSPGPGLCVYFTLPSVAPR